MILLLTTLPLANFLFILAFGKRLSKFQLYVYVFVSMVLSCLTTAALAPLAINGTRLATTVGSWAVSGLFETKWGVCLDPVTFVMLVVVLPVSSIVHTYSLMYMEEDPHLPRFVSYLSFFTFFMLLLVAAENFVSLFVG
jgi:NADH-quinone oxidoreductase subunit L